MQLIENDIVFKVSVGEDDIFKDMLVFVDELVFMLFKILVEKVELNRMLSFSVNCVGEDIGVIFVGIFLGYEFILLVLVLF